MRSQIRIIPSFAVIENGVFVPNFPGFVGSDAVEIFGSAAEWPILPPWHVTVMNSIVVNVVQSSPTMPFIAHTTFNAAVPDLAALCLFFFVPGKRRAAV